MKSSARIKASGSIRGIRGSSGQEEGLPSLYYLLEQRQDVDTEILMVPLPDGDPKWHRAVIKVIFDGNQADSAIGRLQNIHGDKLERGDWSSGANGTL